MRRCLLVCLVAAVAAAAACAPVRRSRSGLEVLLGAIPLPTGSVDLEYEDAAAARRAGVATTADAKAEQVLTDGTWTATGGAAIRADDAGPGVDVQGYRVNAAAGRLARTGLLITGPPGQGRRAIEWLAQADKSAIAAPGLLDVARAAGEPGRLTASPATACGALWLAAAELFPVGSQPARSAFVLVYATGEDAVLDLPRFRAAVQSLPGLLIADQRPRYNVAIFDGPRPHLPPGIC